MGLPPFSFDTRLLENKTPAETFPKCVLLTDRIEIHQLQPLGATTSCYGALIGGFRSDLSQARLKEILETFPRVVAHQRKSELKTYSARFISVEYVCKYTNYQPMSSSHSPVAIDAREVTKII